MPLDIHKFLVSIPIPVIGPVGEHLEDNTKMSRGLFPITQFDGPFRHEPQVILALLKIPLAIASAAHHFA
ncbi:MAG: hypothetical protein WCS01_07520, partial [bacterium]